MRFDRFEALKREIEDGSINFAMMLADFHLTKGNLTQEQFNELDLLAYPKEVEPVVENDET